MERTNKQWRARLGRCGCGGPRPSYLMRLGGGVSASGSGRQLTRQRVQLPQLLLLLLLLLHLLLPQTGAAPDPAAEPQVRASYEPDGAVVQLAVSDEGFKSTAHVPPAFDIIPTREGTVR
jgi:hypothetical protein